MSRSDQSKPARIRRAFATLPEPAAEVFRRHAVDGEDYASIARRMNLGVAEVERLLAEAILLIDRALRRDEEGGVS
jgi:DNA-directed RNA polymerase specialized sigma24 family protein